MDKSIFEKMFNHVNPQVGPNNADEAKEPKDTEEEAARRRDNKNKEDKINKKAAKKLGIKVKEEKEECPGCAGLFNDMHRENFGEFSDIEKDMNKSSPETLKTDQSNVVFKKDNAFVARESTVSDSVDFRHLLAGVRKDVAENYSETCGICPDEIGVSEPCKTDATVPIGNEMDKSAARNAEVVQAEKDLKQAVGQNCAQQQADAKTTTTEPQACETEKVKVIVEEPKEEIAVEDPKGEISATVESKDKFGRTWKLSKKELCSKCGQPDNTGDCNCKKLSDEDVKKLKETKVSEEYTTSSDTSGQPANAAAAKQDVKKSTARSQAIDFRSRKANKGLGYGKREYEAKKDVKEERDPWLPHLAGTCMVCGKPSKIAGDRGDEYCSVECQNAPAPKSNFRAISHPTDLGVVGRPPRLESRRALRERTKEQIEAEIEALSDKIGDLDGEPQNADIRAEYQRKINKLERELKRLLPIKDRMKTLEATSEGGYYDIMRNQGGPGRTIIKWKYIDSPGTMSSHFASVEEFLTEKGNDRRKIEWYKVGNGDKVAMTESTIVSINESPKIVPADISDFRSIFEGTKKELKKKSRIRKNSRVWESFEDDKEPVPCSNCGSKDVESFRSEGDTLARCKNCKRTVENNVETYPGDVNKKVKEAKINEYDAFPGGGTGTVAVDASSIPPVKNETPEMPEIAKAQNPETHSENEKQPEADEHGEKEYFGKQGDDNYYYILAVSDEGEGSQAGVASEPKPDVTPTVKPAEEAPVEAEAKTTAPEISTAKESKVTEDMKDLDVSDDNNINKKIDPTITGALDDQSPEVIAKAMAGRKENDELERSWKMDNSRVPNEAIMRIPKTWYTKKMVESITKMLLSEGYAKLQIIDANGTVVADAEEQEVDPNNIKDFLLKNMDDLELTEIAPDIVKKYLLADEQSTEDEEMTQTPEEEKTIKNQGEPPNKSEEVEVGASVASESKTEESTMKTLLEKFKLNETATGILYVDEQCRDVFQKELDAAFGAGNWRLDGNKFDIWDLAQMPDTIEVPVMGSDFDTNYETRLGTAIITNRFYIEDLGQGKFVECEPETIEIVKGEGEGPAMESLLDKFGLTEPITVESLLEKFQLNEADPVVFKGRPQEDLRDKDLTGKEVTPDMAAKEPVPAEAGTATAVEEPPMAAPAEAPMGAAPAPAAIPGGPAEPIAPVQAQDMSTPESAKAYIQSEYPEEPYTSTAIAYADSSIADPNVYGKVRNMQWGGIWGDADTLNKQAKIVGEYGNFSPSTVKAITDKFGNSAKYKLARDVRPVIYLTVRDVGAGVEPVSLSELKGISGAREVVATENPGECKIVY